MNVPGDETIQALRDELDNLKGYMNLLLALQKGKAATGTTVESISDRIVEVVSELTILQRHRTEHIKKRARPSLNQARSPQTMYSASSHSGSSPAVSLDDLVAYPNGRYSAIDNSSSRNLPYIGNGADDEFEFNDNNADDD